MNAKLVQSTRLKLWSRHSSAMERARSRSASDSPATTAKPFAKDRCWKCHNEHAAVDNVFVQFYPVLRDAAPKR